MKKTDFRVMNNQDVELEFDGNGGAGKWTTELRRLVLMITSTYLEVH